MKYTLAVCFHFHPTWALGSLTRTSLNELSQVKLEASRIKGKSQKKKTATEAENNKEDVERPSQGIPVTISPAEGLPDAKRSLWLPDNTI
jgi:hypothetical protein